MNKASKILIFLIFPIQLLAQSNETNNWKNFANQYDNLYKPLIKTEILNISLSQDLSAKGFNNKFFYPFIFNNNLEKNNIDNNLKKDGFKKIDIEKTFNITYINLKKTPFKNKNIHWLINTASNNTTSIKLTNDATKLIFKGNTDSTKYNFDDCHYYKLSFNKMGAGIFYINEKASKPYNLSFAVNFIQIKNYTSFVSFKNNYLKSNEDSFDLGLNYDATFASHSLSNFDGMGLSTDFNFNYKYNKNSIFSIRINDLGFAKFKNSITFYTSNNVYKYDGIYIPDISMLNNDSYFQNQIDSTVNRFTNKQEKLDKTLFIAPQTEASITTLYKKGYYSATLRQNGTKSQPALSLRYFRFFNPFIIGGASISYFNNIYLNADASFAFRNKFFIQLGIKHLEALLLPSNFGGVGFNCGFQFIY